MKRELCTLAVLAMGLVGCSNGSKATYGTTPANESVTDVTATPSVSSTPAYTPAPVAQPVVADSMMSAPVSSSAMGSSMSGGSYTVKRGDTLYGIAKQKYGDGKQWQKIASANPGLQPSTLKVGQKIVLP